jgi:hypothetical protein
MTTDRDIEALKESYPVSEDVERLNSSGYKAARGIAPRPEGSLSPEDAISKGRGNPINAVKEMPPEKVKKLRKAVGIGNKYHAIRTYSALCDRTFDSKAEATYGEGLAMALKARAIEDLRYQVKFVLCEKPKITVTIDFTYLENGRRIYEDVKGVLTRDSRTKYAWLKEKYGVEVRLIR